MLRVDSCRSVSAIERTYLDENHRLRRCLRNWVEQRRNLGTTPHRTIWPTLQAKKYFIKIDYLVSRQRNGTTEVAWKIFELPVPTEVEKGSPAMCCKFFLAFKKRRKVSLEFNGGTFEFGDCWVIPAVMLPVAWNLIGRKFDVNGIDNSCHRNTKRLCSREDGLRVR